MLNADNAVRLKKYRELLNVAVERRKNNITTKKLAEKLKVPTTSLYRLESGVNDIKVSTFMAYLEGFGFTIELVPDLKAKKIAADMVLDLGDEPIIIESNKPAIDMSNRRDRLRLLQYLLKMEEMYLENGD